MKVTPEPILPADVRLDQFLSSRKPFDVAKERITPRISESIKRAYDAETDRLLQFLRGQRVAAEFNHTRKAS